MANTPSAGEDAKQLELSHTVLEGKQNGTATLENSLTVSYKLTTYTYHTTQQSYI